MARSLFTGPEDDELSEVKVDSTELDFNDYYTAPLSSQQQCHNCFSATSNSVRLDFDRFGPVNQDVLENEYIDDSINVEVDENETPESVSAAIGQAKEDRDI